MDQKYQTSLLNSYRKFIVSIKVRIRILRQKMILFLEYYFFILEYGTLSSGKPNVFLPENSKPHEVVEMVITNEYLDDCITPTNPHKEEDEELSQIFPQGISNDEKVRTIA